MKNKKGIIKIFEAAISITLIMGFVVLIYSQGIEKPRQAENILKWQGSVLDQIKDDPLFREIIMKNEGACGENLNLADIQSFIGDSMKNTFPGFNFTCRVCNSSDVCGIPAYKPEVFSEERIVSATLTEFSPKKIRMFMWRQEE